MKKVIYLGVGILGLGLLAFANPVQPDLTIKITPTQGAFIDNSFGSIKAALDNSVLPSNQTTVIKNTLDSVQRILVKGIQQPKVELPKVDTIKPKKR